MIKATRLITDADRQRINAAIADAELHTSAEIVPVVASASGRYDRAEDIAGLWLGGALAAIVFLFMPEYADEAGSWAGASTAWKLTAILLALVVGFIAGAVVTSRAWTIRRLFTPGKQMRHEVDAAARTAFFDASIHHTDGASGVLIYVSLYERRAVILADRHVVERVGQDSIDGWCERLTDRLRTGSLADAVHEQIEIVGPLLGDVMPRADEDANELSDELVVFD